MEATANIIGDSAAARHDMSQGLPPAVSDTCRR
jgi:hypothetical protein